MPELTLAEREKKVADIRKALECTGDWELFDKARDEYMPFLLAERDRLQQELADSRKNHIDANERNMRAEADLAKERERQNELREDWRSQT